MRSARDGPARSRSICMCRLPGHLVSNLNQRSGWRKLFATSDADITVISAKNLPTNRDLHDASADGVLYGLAPLMVPHFHIKDRNCGLIPLLRWAHLVRTVSPGQFALIVVNTVHACAPRRPGRRDAAPLAAPWDGSVEHGRKRRTSR